jgi:hypothetical protein
MFSETTENTLPANTMASADENRDCQKGSHGYHDTAANPL